MRLQKKQTNKRKIVNDPVHGFINITSELIFDLIEHPYFQRLRRIKQLGLTHYVYPGAVHSRFLHALGALHLMSLAIDNLRSKNIEITQHESEAVQIAILLHDIGHGPFSHALEKSIISEISHEDISELLMQNLNREFEGKLDLAINIFKNKYHKQFLHKLVSSQLDMDRLDYIKRDSFFTGVTEGTIGTDRIIKMLNVVDDDLVVEKKGIYSVEKFLIARRLMYWQVYFHKTVMAAEYLLLNLLRRAKFMAEKNDQPFATPSLEFFLNNTINKEILNKSLTEILNHFIQLDDTDIVVSAKSWINSNDSILSVLANNLVQRNLPKVVFSENPFTEEYLSSVKDSIQLKYNINNDETGYFFETGEISNNAFGNTDDIIQIMYSQNSIYDISEVSDILNVPYLQRSEKKYFACFPKDCGE
ncbi:MAG: HD domain-containing protein [Bacteroidales bacterium]|nr:HD domain-containing protein [Bacteroidales bacterium]